MFSRIVKLLGIGVALGPQANAEQLPAPYQKVEVDYIYNLMFCDNTSLFYGRSNAMPAYWQKVLFLEPNEEKIRKIAANREQESRVRILAFNWLRNNNQSVKKGVILGVIVEVPLEHGLDALAAYADGSVRYINQTGKMTIIDGGAPRIEALARRLIETSRPAVKRMAPRSKPRTAPPKGGNIRLTFLVSDGPYVSEGLFDTLQKEPSVAPIINEATKLLLSVVELSTKETVNDPRRVTYN